MRSTDASRAATLLAALLTVCLLPMAAVWTTTAPAAAGTWRVSIDRGTDVTRDLDEFADRVLAQINGRRARHGKSPIRLYETCVDRFAERWSRWLARTGRFEHRNQRRVLRRCDYSWAGENLARGTAMSPRDVVRAWWWSRGHRAVMMKARADRAGLAVRRDAEGRLVVVLNLGDSR